MGIEMCRTQGYDNAVTMAGIHAVKEVNLTQRYLWTNGLTLDQVVTKLEVLRLFLYKERSHLEKHAIEQTLLKSNMNCSKEKNQVQEKCGGGASKRCWTHSKKTRGRCLSALFAFILNSRPNQ
ncbi:hypothetical protein CHS0354_017683 [Potamilus streckersoni]|uniref:Uncharacterized protein n=1 Tax=Potamilus streckersoni TaxID=2493646 RepID=A0AAE0S7W4_9BIVA|nr:hypothetical protein CHS0354_017683 [Potamilus streckersoni]